MKRILRILLLCLVHCLAILSLYIIFCVGLDSLWKIPTPFDYEKINNVIINLSYSYASGYVVFILTTLLPAHNRNKRARNHLMNLMNDMYEHKLKVALTGAMPIEKYKKDVNDDDVISSYKQANLTHSYSIAKVTKKPLIDCLKDQRKQVSKDINLIIFKYANDISYDLLDKLEGLLNSKYFTILDGYDAAVLLNKWDSTMQEELVKEMLIFRNSVQDIIKSC